MCNRAIMITWHLDFNIYLSVGADKSAKLQLSKWNPLLNLNLRTDTDFTQSNVSELKISNTVAVTWFECYRNNKTSFENFSIENYVHKVSLSKITVFVRSSPYADRTWLIVVYMLVVLGGFYSVFVVLL